MAIGYDKDGQQIWIDETKAKGPQTVAQYNQAIIKLAKEALQAYRDIQNDLRLPDDNKPQLLVEAKEANRKKLVQLSGEAKAAAERNRQAIRSQAAQQYLPQDKNPYEVAADEQTWRRVQGLLDAGVHAHEIVERAASTGDRRTIAVIERELPAYTWARDGSPEMAAKLTPFLDEAKYATGSESYKTFADKAKEADQLAQIVAYNASAADQAVKGENTTLMGDDGSAINTDDSSGDS